MKKLFYVFLILCASCKDEEVNEMPGDQCIDSTRGGVTGACTTIYDPVCGCNNVTYGNACDAKVSGVLSWSKGECPD